MINRSPTGTLHFPALDSLRGLAAFGVVLAHVGAFYHGANIGAGGFKRAISALERIGHPAVILFFVLSGFVLMLAYGRQHSVNYSEFLVRRVFRIYPAYLVCFCGALLCFLLIAPVPSPTLGKYWNDVIPLPQHWGSVGAMATLLFYGDGYSVLPVTWSLVHEMRFSLLFPAMLIAVKWLPKTLTVLAVVALAATSAYSIFVYQGHMFLGESETGSLVITAVYLPVFAVGMLLAFYIDTYAKAIIPDLFQGVGFVVAAGLIIADVVLISAASACIMIVLCVTKTRVRSILSTPPLVYLGRISFSLYVVHFPILFYATMLSGRTALLPALIAGAVCSVAAAAILNIAVEGPFQRVGKKLVGKGPPPIREPGMT